MDLGLAFIFWWQPFSGFFALSRSLSLPLSVEQINWKYLMNVNGSNLGIGLATWQILLSKALVKQSFGCRELKCAKKIRERNNRGENGEWKTEANQTIFVCGFILTMYSFDLLYNDWKPTKWEPKYIIIVQKTVATALFW